MNFFRKQNNLDELSNIPIKVEGRSVIQIFLGPKVRTWDRYNPESASEITADPRSTVFSKSANTLDLTTNPQSVRFLRPNPSIQKPIHPPPFLVYFKNYWMWRNNFVLYNDGIQIQYSNYFLSEYLFFYSVAFENCFLKLMFFTNSNSLKKNRRCMIIL